MIVIFIGKDDNHNNEDNDYNVDNILDNNYDNYNQ